ncbi:hypothetical protein DXG03_001051 [Asterophora parasitica]|uniref:Uncharacterized protein n=1 Tax=Asterophora parasitica TaxID=117018 RepID=A0A9P7FZJ5_9AGAR|nr:hypothetical protein DXG03_001051 [Asterophora parasitica]
MSASPGKSHFWVWFHFGIVSGAIRSRAAPPTFVGDTVHFQWGGRKEGEGETTFDNDNTGRITFLGDGKIRRKMRWMGSLFEFVGKKVAGDNVVRSNVIGSWKEEYRGINSRTYEAARVARWPSGYYVGDERDDITSNSDTETQSD